MISLISPLHYKIITPGSSLSAFEVEVGPREIYFFSSHECNNSRPPSFKDPTHRMRFSEFLSGILSLVLHTRHRFSEHLHYFILYFIISLKSIQYSITIIAIVD